MPTPRLTQQYTRLLQHFAGQDHDTCLQQLAEVLVCSRRHMRSLLLQMQQAGWIQWQAQAGRGMRSRLTFLKQVEQLQRENAETLLAQGQLEQVVRLLGDDRSALTRLLRTRLGRHADRDRQVLGVPYYRPLPNLYPGTPLRRSEQHLVRQIFNGLTSINEEKEEVSADLAHHWQQYGACEWHFHLRPAVRWHDGRELSVEDICASLQRLCALPLFSHLRAVRPLSARGIAIELSHPDQWLPWLLADCAALILPQDHAQRPDFAARPIGTGPYRVAVNDAYRLSLQAFDDYFGYRALLDEVNIWMLPEWNEAALRQDSQPCIMQVQLSSQPTPPAGDHPQEMVMEQGAFFLLSDARSACMRRPALRAWLSHALAPLAVSRHVPPHVHQYWIPASGLLPSWHHQLPAPASTTPHGVGKLRLAFYQQQPTYRLIAQAMAQCLRQHGVELECCEIPYADWVQGRGDFELWLGSINFATRPEYSVPAWIFGTPLLRAALPDDDALPLARWQQAWHQGELQAQALSAQLTRQHWLLPLFHGWLQLGGPAQMRGLHLNSLGWFDFKSAWLAPA